jgi:hypothetical protein
MWSAGQTHELPGSLDVFAQFALRDAWKEREAGLNVILREEVPEVCEGSSLVAAALGYAGIQVDGPFWAAAYCNGGQEWTYQEYFEFGVKISPEEKNEHHYVGFGALDNGGNIACYYEDRDPLHAEFLADIIRRKVRWTCLRGVRVSSDATALRLPGFIKSYM